MQAESQIPGYDHIRFSADASNEELFPWRQRLAGDRTESGLGTGLNLLAISSGSDKGAFSAGFLKGWSAVGTRPEFDIVVGVSTGAMIAPLAFLGREYDPVLERIYTTIGPRDIYRPTPISGLVGGPSFASSKPLAEMIDRQITPAMVEEIAAQHARGSRLLVMTTNLDSQRGTVWDIGAIAQSSAPDRERLIERALLASASIPSLLPPVLIDVQSGGQSFTEMHVDGGTTASAFAVPPALLWNDEGGGDLPQPLGTITILYNGQIETEYEVVEPTAFEILTRSLETMIGSADRALIQTYQ
jgi:predicted acylesterase/phospholipase RssA